MKSIFTTRRKNTSAESVLSFRRDVGMTYLDVMIPTKTGRNKAKITMTSCHKGECVESELLDKIKEVKITSDKGISVDIETPHEFTVLFNGKPNCKEEGDHLACTTGDFVEKSIEASGELVASFETDVIELKNIPYRTVMFIETIYENANNHWYFNNMKDDVHEINIPPEKIKEVVINLRHPMLTSARIHLKEKMKCEVLADAEWIRERRKLYCL